MIKCARAIVVVSPSDLEATFAFVNDAQHVTFLQQVCRIHGSPEGNVSTASAAPQRLRLALEEIIVGVAKGFLCLESASERLDDSSKTEDDDCAIVERIVQEVAGCTRCTENAGDSKWMLSPQRRDRLRIFLNLWDKGYIVTFGSKFGADFLIYKDNPKRAHAVALIVVKHYKEEFARVDVVSFCRVAKMVKKQLLLACVRLNEDYGSGSEQKGDSKISEREVEVIDIVYVSLTHALLVSRQEDREEST